MGKLNSRGVRFVHDKTRPLAVSTMDEAAQVLMSKLVNERTDLTDMTTDKVYEWARGVLWEIGFDMMTQERREVHDVLDKIV